MERFFVRVRNWREIGDLLFSFSFSSCNYCGYGSFVGIFLPRVESIKLEF